ncbi:MAG: hypothetical protein ACREP0_12730, partial [Rhodanobacteraceae bacterium]
MAPLQNPECQANRSTNLFARTARGSVDAAPETSSVGDAFLLQRTRFTAHASVAADAATIPHCSSFSTS